MSIQPLSEDTRNTLELFVERTAALAQFVSANPFGGGIVGLFREVDEQEWQIHSAINGTLCILRSFLQSQDGITLFSIEEARPDRAEEQGPRFLQTLIGPLPPLGQLPPLRRPTLFDLNVSASWLDVVHHAYDQLYLTLAIEPENLLYQGQKIGSCNFLVKHFQAKELETSSTIHESLVRFDLVHHAFHRPLTPRKA